MAVKVLERGSNHVIIGHNGRLRIIDRRKPRCHGYQNCCQCPECLARAAKRVTRPRTARCQCETPLAFAGNLTCFRCGKATRGQKAA